MGGESPASVLYSSDGYELAVVNTSAIPAGTRAILFAGSDGTDSRYVLVDSSGRQVVVGAGTAGTQSGGVVTIQGDPAGTPVPISGTVTATNSSVGSDGSAALAFDTQVGGKVTTAAPTYTTGNLNALSLTTTGDLRVVSNQGTSPWVVSGTVTANQGTSPWVTSVSGTVAVTQSTSPWVVSGTGGTFDNRSVGSDAAAALAFDTQVGGKTTTAAPTYTTGNLDVLSLTTLGGLRIDGVYVAGTANATAADVGNVGGYVTTAAPTYTTGQLNPLSLDTSGSLRVTGFVTTNKAATSTTTNVASSATNVTLLAANANRIFASVYNDSSKTVFIKLGTTASNTSFSILLMPNSYWEVPNDYTGQIDAIWSSANGNARITELTP